LEPEFIDLIRNARKRKVDKFRNQLSVFLACLIISIFLWLLVHLSKEYFYTTEYRLNYTQVPWNMNMLSCSDSVLILTIRLQGYEFFSEQFFRRKKRECDVSLRGMKMKIGDDQVTGYLLTRGIARDIAERTAYPLEIFTTSPDTIFFTFDKKVIKRLSPVKITPLNVDRSADTVLIPHDSAQGKIQRLQVNKKDPTPEMKSDAESRSDRKHR
jgi:hypothetical protein